MSDKYRIDSHKLIYHPERVAQWINQGDVYPIYVEIAPSGTCNHRCVFCALDYLEYKPVFLDKDLIIKNLKIMAGKGIKSVMYAGEGEPLLNKHTPEIINKTKSLGIDVSMTSNGSLFNKDVAEECLHSFSWVRFSVNAGSEETYQKVHNTKAGEFTKVLDNISNAIQLKKQKNLAATIGVQLLLIPQNTHEVVQMGEKLKEIGVDYYTVKPFSQHPKSINKMEDTFNYQQHLEIEQMLNNLVTKDFNIIFRSNAMKKLQEERGYERCLGNCFWAYVDAKANVWACSAYLGDEDFCFGSMKELDFNQIWEGQRRKEFLERINEMDVHDCREICRLDEINRYLHQLRYPNAHVNFI